MKKIVATLVALLFMVSMASALVLRPITHHGKGKTEIMAMKKAHKEIIMKKWEVKK